MTSRERVRMALNHRQPDKVPFDIGSTVVSGIAASALKRLRGVLGLSRLPLYVHEPFQILGRVEEEDVEKLGVDVIALPLPGTMFGYKNEDWKPWKLFDGTEVLVGGGFRLTEDEHGNRYIHPRGDLSAPPSGMLPKGGLYFDNIVRQKPLDETRMDGRRDHLEDFTRFDEETLRHLETVSKHLYENTSKAINGAFFQLSLGDFSHIPGPSLPAPEGIRSPEEWLIAHYQHEQYIKDTYAFQAENALHNLKLYKQAVGDRIDIIQVSGTDFGSQISPMLSPDFFREFYKPHYAAVNAWIHENTRWKAFYHSCGAVLGLLPDFVDMGVDIINPVQISAKGMDPEVLKARFGDRLTFWGGGTNTQVTLPFGTPAQVRAETLGLMRVLSKGGGFVCGAVHNIQANTPIENMLAFIQAVHEFDPAQEG